MLLYSRTPCILDEFWELVSSYQYQVILGIEGRSHLLLLVLYQSKIVISWLPEFLVGNKKRPPSNFNPSFWDSLPNSLQHYWGLHSCVVCVYVRISCIMMCVTVCTVCVCEWVSEWVRESERERERDKMRDTQPWCTLLLILNTAAATAATATAVSAKFAIDWEIFGSLWNNLTSNSALS